MTAVPEIDVVHLGSLTASGVPVVDVRMPDEYAAGHVPGATLLPLPEVPERAGELPRDRTVYLICRSGARSQRACAYLRDQGVDAVNVTGGTLAWIEAGHDVVTGPDAQ